jgi:hypothetical protein
MKSIRCLFVLALTLALLAVALAVPAAALGAQPDASVSLGLTTGSLAQPESLSQLSLSVKSFHGTPLGTVVNRVVKPDRSLSVSRDIVSFDWGGNAQDGMWAEVVYWANAVVWPEPGSPMPYPFNPIKWKFWLFDAGEPASTGDMVGQYWWSGTDWILVNFAELTSMNVQIHIAE